MTERTPSHRSNSDWCWIGTANPAEMIFALYVNTQDISLTNKPVREVSAFGSTPYSLPTQFKDLDVSFATQHLVALGIGDWYFIGESIGNPTSTFYFFKNKTSAEANTPWKIEEETGNHPWPMVVEAVWPEVDYGWSQSASMVLNGELGTVTGPVIYIRDRYLPPVSEGTKFITRYFLSATKPLIRHHKVPEPGPLHVQVNGVSRDFGECLHPDITVDPLPSGTVFISPSGSQAGIGGGTGRQHSPATNFEARKKFILSDKPVQNGYGLWERKQIEVAPPKGQEALTR